MSTVSLSSFIKSSSYWSKLTGIRWPLVLSLIVFWATTLWLQSEYKSDDSNLWLVMNLFIQFLQILIIGLFSISLLTAITTWIYFITLIRSKRINLQVKFGDGQKAEAGWVPLSVMMVGPILRPLLGTVQARLIFSKTRISERIILDSNIPKPRNWWRQGIRGTGQTLLYDRGIYDVEKVLVSFCDMFGLVSLPYSIAFSQQLYTLPQPLTDKKVKAQPHSTEEQKHRIEIPKRVEGEYVNYKEFETGDNIQRIVWKIYAKSGDLVVRVPEIKDPYASHLYLYVSFYHGFNLKEGAFENELLNVYKDLVRNLFEAVQKNGYDVRIPKDQEVPKLAGLGDKKIELFQITAANWQNKITPTEYVKADKAAFVCLSSLTPASEIEVLAKKLPAAIPLVIIKLSDAIASPFQMSIKNIFFRPEPKPSDKLRQPWFLSSLRKSLQGNEKEIENLLRNRDNCWLTDTLALEHE
ncbi:MAG TPA: hypothetical protein DGG95_04175 [Cytophagales bacterium]|jgi:hypothetical protein|nr:hypothetical protein [Cytophagales bacterium]